MQNISKPRLRYRYKLNDNQKANDCIVDGVFLTHDWRDLDRHFDKLEKHIRTKDNPVGIIDFEEYNPISDGIVNSSVINFEKKLPMYKREVLATMKRPQIVEIAKSYNINPILKRDAFLINLILEKQVIYQNASKEIVEKKSRVRKVKDEKISG